MSPIQAAPQNNDSAAQRPAEREFDPQRIKALNEKYRPLTPEQRITELYRDFEPSQVMLTSSFAATSAFLLHVFSRTAPHQRVFFIDTGYHFPQTLEYKRKLTELYHLDVVDIRAEDWKHEFTLKDETWKKDPDFCCSINKVEPIYALKQNYEVWASGLMRWQTEHRATLDVFEARNGIIKFYPLIDITREQRDAYIAEHQLPFHPLVAVGYSSIGCTHCTVPGKDRSGRWNNSPKTECGLHL
ncbi:MAG: phosphoadenylyl-sulfate reductase [Chromatiales bacterium]|jgi:phosphoadenosine phosphosulfate reductase|nr:phosphoadenylyl-sulfate reductase [Chromatiales bacterium]